MYESFFGLKEKPFNLTPDPRYFYLSDSHREALAALVYGVRERAGLITLTGPVGVGKTMILASFLDQIRGHGEAVSFSGAISGDRLEFLKDLCCVLGITPEQVSLFGVSQAIREFAVRKAGEGRGVVVLVDEAQDLGLEELDHFHHLSNLETAETKLLQIVLAGTDSLSEKLKDKALEALWQRVAVRCVIKPIEPGETIEYIFHRMRVAGSSSAGVFSDDALWRIVNFARGVPRLINLLCNHAMISAYSAGRFPVDEDAVQEAMQELQGGHAGVGIEEIVGRHEIRKMVEKVSRGRPEETACSGGQGNPAGGEGEDHCGEAEAGEEEGTTDRNRQRRGLLSWFCSGRRLSLVLALAVLLALAGVVMAIGLLRARDDGGEPAEAGVLQESDTGWAGDSGGQPGLGYGMSRREPVSLAEAEVHESRTGLPAPGRPGLEEASVGLKGASSTKTEVSAEDAKTTGREKDVAEIALEHYRGLTAEILRELREKNPQIRDWNNLARDVRLVLPEPPRPASGEADFYTIQVGAFHDEQRATRRASALAKKGAQNLFLVKGGVDNAFTFVCVGVFESGRQCSGGIGRVKEWGFDDAFPIRIQEKRLEDIVWRKG